MGIDRWLKVVCKGLDLLVLRRYTLSSHEDFDPLLEDHEERRDGWTRRRMSLVDVNKGGLLVLVSDLVTNDSRSNLPYYLSYSGPYSRRRPSKFSSSLSFTSALTVLG